MPEFKSINGKWVPASVVKPTEPIPEAPKEEIKEEVKEEAPRRRTSKRR